MKYYFLKFFLGKLNVFEVICFLYGNLVKLKCDVFLYDELFLFNYVYWIKGVKYIVIVVNDEKYLGVDINDLLLIIYNVNNDDVGEY